MKKGVLYALITAILFVTLEPVSKLIAGEVNPYAITFWRFFIGSFILIPPAIKKIKKNGIHLTGMDFVKMILLGILFICISMILLQVGVKAADSPALIAIVFSANSIFTIAFAVIINKEKLNLNKTLALIFGIVGVLLCADFSSGTNLTSILLGLLAAITFSLYTVLSKKYSSKTGGIIQSAVVFLTGSIVLLIALLVMGIDISVPLHNTNTLWILIYLGLGVTGLGYACYFAGIDAGGVIMGSLAFFIKPILTPFVTLIINGVPLSFKVFLAVACIVLASYFAIRKEKNNEASRS